MGVKVREKVKGSGEWWIFIDYKNKRRAKKIGKDKKLAIKAAQKINARLTLGEFEIEEKSIPTFGDYAKIWLDVTLPATCKPSTISDYKGLLSNHIYPVFKNIRVTDINRLSVKSFLMGKIKEGKASSTVTHMKNAISGVLNLSIDDNILIINPAQKLGKIFQHKTKMDNITPLTKKELNALLSSFLRHYPKHFPMALTLSRTGMRLGEVAALQWDDIDIENRFIHVRRGFSRGKIETPKSGKTRKVDMSKQLTETLKQLKQQRRLEALKNGWGKPKKWVFINESGNTVDTCNWRKRVYKEAIKKAGLREVRIHDLRHTFASMLIQAGESLVYIRDQLGHHSIKVTVDIYGHLSPEGNKAAVDKLDDLQIASL